MNTYPLYKDSDVEWIGEIPSDWRCLRGRFLFENKKIINKEFQCENLLSLTLFGVLNKDMESHEGLRPSNYKTYQIFEKDDLVFKLIDLENVKTSRVGLVHEKGIMSPVYIRIEPNKNSHPKYNYYYFYDLYKKEIFNFLGSGVRLSLSPSDLLEIEVPVPPLQEQQQISDYLDYKTSKIYTLIENTQQKIELLKEQRTSLINTTVTKGLNPNVEMKDSGVEWIGEIPSEWGVVSIKRLCSIKRGSSPRPIDNPDYFDEKGEFSWVRIADVSSSNRYLEKTKQQLSELGSSLSTKRYPDDLFLSIAGTVGKPIITKIKCCIHDGFVWFDDLNTNKEFLYYIFSVGQCFKGLGKMGTQLNLNTDTVGLVKIPLMNNKEQQKIVDYLDLETLKIDKLVDIESNRIDLLKEYRESLISDVVTGKVDIRDEVLV